MTASIKRARTRVAAAQEHRCYYCGSPMWECDPDSFASAHSLTKSQARLFRCTAEHLHARSDGGSSAASNLVAACWFCNSHRHYARYPLEPDEYRIRVSQRMKRGQWLAGVAPKMLRSPSAS